MKRNWPWADSCWNMTKGTGEMHWSILFVYTFEIFLFLLDSWGKLKTCTLQEWPCSLQNLLLKERDCPKWPWELSKLSQMITQEVFPALIFKWTISKGEKTFFFFFYLCFVQWGFLGPFKQVFVHIPIIAAKHRAQCHILKVKCINQSNSVGANHSQ